MSAERQRKKNALFLRIADQPGVMIPLVGLLSFLLLCGFLSAPVLKGEEAEIFAFGTAMARGLRLYSELGTSHMPLPYFLAAFFAQLGSSDPIAFRVAFYAFFSALYTLLYARYASKCGRLTMLLFPALYIFTLSLFGGGVIVRGHLVGIGLAILLLELWIFIPGEKRGILSSFMIALGVALSFGSSFLALPPILVIAATVFLMELRRLHKEKSGYGKNCLYFLRQYSSMLILTALPFVLLCVYFLSKNSIRAFYAWAYLLNRHVYPLYNHGFGANLPALFFQGLSEFGRFLWQAEFNGLFFASRLLLFLALLALIASFAARRDLIFFVGTLFFVMTSAGSGLFSLTGLPAVSVLSLLSAFALAKLLRWNGESRSRLAAGSLALLALLLFLAFPYVRSLSFGLAEQTAEEEKEETRLAEALSRITEPSERVGTSLGDWELLLEADLLPATVTGGETPWVWQWGGPQAMTDLYESPPRYYLMDLDRHTDGMFLRDYAQDLIVFLNVNYTSLSPQGHDKIFVRNDVLEDTLSRLQSGSLKGGAA